MDYFLTLILLCTIFANVHSWHYFHNGRVRGGNVGTPKAHGLTEEPRNFTRWFKQNLDHFDIGNEVTWQQVIFHLF